VIKKTLYTGRIDMSKIIRASGNIAALFVCAAFSATVLQSSADSISSRGGVISFDGEFVIHTFTESSTFTLPKDVIADILLVGGGGGGGSSQTGGGGGAGGGVIYRQNVNLTAGTYEIQVGAGGKGGSQNASGSGGGRSIAFGITANAGGGGGGVGKEGNPGASGGGGSCAYETDSVSVKKGGLAVYEGQGFPGGASTNATRIGSNTYHTHCWAGGGGGAGGPGGNGVCTVEGDANDYATKGYAGVGGIGRACSITGSEVYYGGGGGGGFADYSGGNTTKAGTVAGGKGGGGNGSGCNVTTVQYDGEDGLDGFGGGGGGSGGFAGVAKNGGNGGSGVVIIRCKVKPSGMLLIIR
jgi:hypothetical protein